ncbi:hypothetical protein FACS1894219_00190 [Clostridia bacterium]|nr:hypothetical protein FACS1894219_00190 [Clostridia bacterium]
MAGQKDQSVVAVIDGLTQTQAANITSDIIKAKNKHAPEARATAVSGNRLDIGKNLSSGVEAIKKLPSGGGSNGKKK